MNRLSERRSELEKWTADLPSPLALPLARLVPQLDKPDLGARIIAGVTALDAGLRFTAYLCVADLLAKLRADDALLTDATLAGPLAAMRKVVEATPTPDGLQSCIAAVMALYKDAPTKFFVPEIVPLVSALGGDVEPFFAMRRRLVQGESKPGANELEATWPLLDERLYNVFNALQGLSGYELAQLHCLPVAAGDGGVSCDRYLKLRGYRMEEKDLSAGPLRLPPRPSDPWRMRQVYLFAGGDRERCLSLHPFVLFQLGGAFFFNGVTQSGTSYTAEESTIELTDEEDRTQLDVVSGPIHQYFVALRALAGGEGFVTQAMGGRQKGLSFQRTIDFHTEGFSGRSEYFEKIDHAIAGPFRCVWIRGFAGYGKSALMARLSQQHPEAIPYFISPERGAAEASTYLRYICEAIIQRFQFSDVLTDEQLSSPKDLKRVLDDLMRRAVEALPENKKLILLVDALDESLRYASSQDEMIDAYLPENRDAVPERVVFIITSRPEEVNLGHLADLTLDLQPFSRDQVVAILGKYGWGGDAAEIAYKKSDGQPIYFRFLLDEAKRGAITAEIAKSLPDGIQAFYDRFWREGDKDEKRHALHRDLLGFLAASAEPLTDVDLWELESGIDPKVTHQDIRAAFTKDRLGRFVIGSRRYSLFHDTLRAFSVERSGIQRYHQMLARWCGQSTNHDYADAHHIYHLLHGKEHSRALEIVGDTGPKGLVKKRMGERRGSQKLTRDLSYAIAAARELNDLDRIFGLTLLQISMKKVKKTAVIPEAVGIMSGLGMNEDLSSLLEGGDNDRERWEIAAKVYSHFLKRGDQKASETWLGHLRKIWMNTQQYAKTEHLIPLLQKLQDEKHIDHVLNVFSDIEAGYRPRALAEGLFHVPAIAAKKILALDTRKADDWYISDRLIQIAHDLVMHGERVSVPAGAGRQLSGDLLPAEREQLGWQVLSLFSIRSLDTGMAELRGLMAKDTARTLSSLRPAQFQIYDWGGVTKVVSFARMLHALAPGQAREHLSRQHADAKLVGTSILGLIGGAADYTHAAQLFEQECGLATTLPMLAALSILILAHHRHKKNEPCPFTPVLARLDGTIRGAQQKFDINEQDLQKELKVLLPRASAYARELEEIFPSKQGALWYAVAAASDAFSGMLDERLKKWLESKAAERGGASAQTDAMVNAVSQKLAEALQYANSRGAVHNLIVPVYLTLAPIADHRPALMSIGAFAQVSDNDVGTVAAEFWATPEKSSALYPLLARDGQYIMGIDNVIERAILQLGYDDPAIAMERFRKVKSINTEMVKARRTELGLEAENAAPRALPEWDASQYFYPDQRPLQAQNLLRLQLACGRADDAYEILKANPSMWEGWSRFSQHGQSCFRRFLDDLPAIAGQSVNDDLRECVKVVLDRLPDDTGRKERVQNLLAAGLPNALVLTLVGYAFRRGLENEALGFLSDQVKSDPDGVINGLSNLLVPWVETVLERSESQATEMWDQLMAFLRGRSLEFLQQLQSSFDAKISAALDKRPPATATYDKIALTLPQDFVQTRRASAVALVKAGAPKGKVEPLLNFSDLLKMVEFLELLGPNDPPPWLREHVWIEFLRLCRALECKTGWTFHAASVWMSPWWTEAERKEARQIIDTQLAAANAAAEQDDERYEYAEWKIFMDALDQDNLAALTSNSERLQQMGYKVQYAGKLNPRLAWRLFAVLPQDIRERYTQEVFANGLRFNPGWTVGEFQKVVTPERARDMVWAVLHRVPKSEWRTVEAFTKHAISLYPSNQETWQITALLPVVEHSVELAAEVLSRHKDPLVWIDYFCQPRNYGFQGESAPTQAMFAFMVDRDLAKWTEQVKALAQDARIEPWTISQKLKVLFEHVAKQDAALKEKLTKPLVEAAAVIVDERKAQRDQILNDLLKPLAALDPQLALGWIKRFAYTGHLLNDVLRVVLETKPDAIEEIYETILRKAEEWTRRSNLIAILPVIPFADAVKWIERDALDMEEWAFSQAKLRLIDATMMQELEKRTGDKIDKRFKLYAYALQKAGKLTTDAQKQWAQKLWDIYSEGKFILNQYDQIGFSVAKDTTAFPYLDNEQFAVLFALFPEKMDEHFNLQVREAKPEVQGKLKSKLDEIRAQAVPGILRASPAFMLEHRSEWATKPWWPYLSDELFAVVAALPSEDALKMLAVAQYIEAHHVRRILDPLTNADEMRECLEVLITEVLVEKPDRLDMILDLLLEYLERASFESVGTLVDWALQFRRAQELIGVQAQNVNALFDKLRSLAAAPGTVTTSSQLTDLQRKRVKDIDMTIRSLRRYGQDTTLFENLRKRILGL